jgi:hypothetical protein
MLNNLEKVDDESRRTSLLDTLCSTEDVLNMPLHQNPPGRASGELRVDLLKHQASRICIFIRFEFMFFFLSFKPCNGVLSAKILPCPRLSPTSLFNSGTLGRGETK